MAVAAVAAGCTGSVGDLFDPVSDPVPLTGRPMSGSPPSGSPPSGSPMSGSPDSEGPDDEGGGGAAPAGAGANEGVGNSGSGAAGTDTSGGNGSSGASGTGSSSAGSSSAGSSGGTSAGSSTGGAGSVEPADSEPPCDSSGPFGAPELVVGLGVNVPSFGPAPSDDGLTLFFSSVDGDENVFFATRSTRANQFSSARLVPGVNDLDNEDGTPFVSADGRSLYLFSTRADDDAPGGRDLWVADRSSSVEFAAPRLLPRVNHDGLDHLPRLSADELTLMFVSGRDTLNLGSNIWVAQRESRTAAFSEPVELAGVNTDAREEGFWLSADELSLFFASNRASTQADMDIWVATRDSVNSAFEGAERLEVVNTSAIEIDPAITPDGFELFFASDRSGTMRLYRSARLCD